MLFFKECKKIVFSLTFLIYLFSVAGFYFTQFAPESNEKISPPLQNIGNYGTIVKETPEILMPSAAESLIEEHEQNCYVVYPFLFYKEVKLTEKKNAQIAEIITELANITDYEKFRELMRKADKIIGGSSKYSDKYILENFSVVQRTYEDELEDYNAIIKEDKITGAYARLFCDYIGIIVSILPVFVISSFINNDKKSHMKQIIYARKISSAKLIFTRFLSSAVILIIPVVLISVLATVQLKSIYSDNAIDLFAITGMSIYWLVPNILFSTALGMFLTECGSPFIAVFLQGAIWIANIMKTANGLKGNIGLFTLVCRHNTLYDRYLFMEDLNKFVFNRIFYTVLAILLVILTTYIYSLKRKGDFHAVRKRFNYHKNKSKA